MSQLSRHDLDSEFAKDEAIFSEPREVDLWPKNVHPHRFVSKGFRMEARITLSALRRRANPKRFMVYGRPRSGTTLLNHLLNQLPDVQADGELMHFGLARPHSFPAVAARNSKRPFYGFKLLSYQLMDVQRITRPLHFFDRAVSDGYKLLHLRRNSWEQTLSLAKAHATGRYFNKTGVGDDSNIKIDPEMFRDLLAWNLRMLKYEDAVMSHLPHMRLQYEDSLRSGEQHQETIDRICQFIGAKTDLVAAKMKRTGAEGGKVVVANMETLKGVAAEMGVSPS